MLEYLLKFISPHLCLGCRTEGCLLCWQCSGILPPVPIRCYRCGQSSPATRICKRCLPHTPLDSMQVVTQYEGLAKDLIHSLKFERAKAAAIPIARLMAVGLAEKAIVASVPTTAKRARQRGYDQSELLARRIAAITGSPYTPLLARSGKQRQLGQNREIRHHQLKGAYRTLRPDLSKSQRIILVDDVLTTGSTLETAAEVLRRAGASHISAVVFAVA